MKRILYAFWIAFVGIGVIIGIPQILNGANIFLVFPIEQTLLILSGLFLIFFIIGIADFNRKQRQKEEEEEREAEQEETNRLMREYLERKLKEENKDN